LPRWDLLQLLQFLTPGRSGAAATLRPSFAHDDNNRL